MNTNIGENIRHYRILKNLTQEELAGYLGVSFQAVSKWERSVVYPDIEIIPSIANFFEITIDELMGNSRSCEEDKICQYIAEYERLELLCTQETDREKNALAKKAYAEFPYDWRIVNLYRHSLICGRDEADYGNTKPTIRFLCERILKGCTNDYFRQCAISSLISISETKDEEEKWLAMLNDDFCILKGECREDIAFEHGRYEEGIKHCQSNLIEYLGWLIFKVETLYDRMNLSLEEKIALNNKIIDIIKLLFEDGDFGEWLWHIASKYEENARIYFSLNRIDEGLIAFEKSVDYCCQYSSLPHIHSYTSVLFNRLDYIRNDTDSADSEYKSAHGYLERIKSMSVYDVVRNDDRFTQVSLRLK